MTAYCLFVYGSLKRGFRHHCVLRGAPFERSARTAKGFRLVLQGEYPALVSGGMGSVEGELYLVTAELLAELDHFEGCPDLYRREPILLEDGSRALTYVVLPERAQALPAIADGRWIEPDRGVS